MDGVVTMAYRVFFADSSPSALKMLHMAFQDSNYDLYTSHDGREVLDLIRQVRPDAVVLGLILPHADGFELALRFREIPEFQKTPLILLLPALADLDTTRLSELDFDEVVLKPFDSEELAHKIRTLISGTRDPQSLPEEPGPIRPEISDTQDIPALLQTGEANMGDEISRRIKLEVLDMERELEKRIAARVKGEIKAWLQFDYLEDSKK